MNLITIEINQWIIVGSNPKEFKVIYLISTISIFLILPFENYFKEILYKKL